MPLYKYKAKKGPEEIINGTIQAQSEQEAIEKLSAMGNLPISIKATEPSFVGTDAGNVQKFSTPEVAAFRGAFKKRVSSREITIFCREIASLLRSGVPILRAISIISEQSQNAYFKSVLGNIHNTVKEGESFSSALSKFPKIFSLLYVAIVKAGENSSTLPEVFLRIADYRRRQDEMMSRLRMAMAYPIFMGVVGLATVIFMFTFAIPRLMQIYVGANQALPVPTKILISISEGIRNGWPIIAIVLAVIVFAIRHQSKAKIARLSLSAFKLHLPVFGKFILKAELARFCRTLELLIKNALPILDAINICIPVLENEIIKNHLRQSHKDLEAGGSFGLSLKNTKTIPIFMSDLIIVGEESGKLDEALGEVASVYEHDTDETLKIFSSLLEPFMILVIGLIVGFIVVAMLLPIFDINVIAQ